ncbi:hypothetical protein HDU87_002485 [Geranomyces variabilis]|uniref:Uncharacterized protein n=1 Tax=Geranomyces variabilis TaxID=109894 RepID=A0AAD5TD26_9FUNG|nr:hypothetical protein HDU87_002485 [Geranomyces variabilis]
MSSSSSTSSAIPVAVSRRSVPGGNSPGNAGGGGSGALAPDPPSSENTMEVNGNVFVLADSVRPALSQFLKQRESTRNLLKRKRNDGTALIPESAAAYGFMSKKKGRWSVSESKNKAAKLFVSHDWINENLNANENAAEPAPILQAAGNVSELHGTERADSPLHDADSAARADSPLHDDEDLEDAPPLVVLSDDKKFRDAEGRILDVEMRGARSADGLFFYARDVAVKMLQQLPKRLTNKLGGGKGDDHQYFKRNGHRALFLNYGGFIRSMFSSRSPFAVEFCKQSLNILFTFYHGNTEEQTQLAKKLLGIEKARTFFNHLYPAKTAAVYMINLGTVGKLRETMGITNPNLADDVLVVKVGFTDDIRDRLKTHKNDFGAIEGAEPVFHKAIIIDKTQLSDCENDVKRALGRHLNWHLTFSGVEKLCDGQRRRPDKTRTEIFGIPPAELRDIEKQFENLQKVHGADYSLMATQYDSLKLAMDQMKELHAAQIREKEVEINALRKELDHEQARLALETGRLKEQLAEQQVRATLEKENIQLKQENLYLKKAAAMSEQLEQLRIALATKQ